MHKGISRHDGNLNTLIGGEKFVVVVAGNPLFSVNEASNISGTIVISRQASTDVLEVKDESGKVIGSHSYIEIGVKEGPVSTPFNSPDSFWLSSPLRVSSTTGPCLKRVPKV